MEDVDLKFLDLNFRVRPMKIRKLILTFKFSGILILLMEICSSLNFSLKNHPGRKTLLKFGTLLLLAFSSMSIFTLCFDFLGKPLMNNIIRQKWGSPWSGGGFQLLRGHRLNDLGWDPLPRFAAKRTLKKSGLGVGVRTLWKDLFIKSLNT